MSMNTHCWIILIIIIMVIIFYYHSFLQQNMNHDCFISLKYIANGNSLIFLFILKG